MNPSQVKKRSIFQIRFWTDFGPDPDSDFGPDPGSDFGPDPGSDFGPDPGYDFGPDPGSDFGPDPESDFGPDPGSDFGPDPGSNGVRFWTRKRPTARPKEVEDSDRTGHLERETKGTAGSKPRDGTLSQNGYGT